MTHFRAFEALSKRMDVLDVGLMENSISERIAFAAINNGVEGAVYDYYLVYMEQERLRGLRTELQANLNAALDAVRFDREIILNDSCSLWALKRAVALRGPGNYFRYRIGRRVSNLEVGCMYDVAAGLGVPLPLMAQYLAAPTEAYVRENGTLVDIHDDRNWED